MELALVHFTWLEEVKLDDLNYTKSTNEVLSSLESNFALPFIAEESHVKWGCESKSCGLSFIVSRGQTISIQLLINWKL